MELSNKKRLDWLYKRVDYYPVVEFSLPIGIEFIRRIRVGLDKFDSSNINGWFELYVWWVKFGHHDYPSYNWKLSSNEKCYLFDTSNRVLPNALTLYAEDRPDLQALIDDVELGFEKYILWWLSDGCMEPFIQHTKGMLVERLKDVSFVPSQKLFLPIEIACIRLTRAEFAIRYPSTVHGWFKLYVWWTVYGQYEYPSITWNLCKDEKSYLFDTSNRVLSNALTLYAEDRPDLQALIDDVELGFEKYILWWLSDGCVEPFVDKTMQILVDYLLSLKNKPTQITIGLPSILEYVWRVRPDLQNIFDINTPDQRYGMLNWWNEYGFKDYRNINLNYSVTDAYEVSFEKVIQNIHSETEFDRMYGVNIIGFAAGVLGIGEDARMASDAVLRAGFEVAALKPKLLWSPSESYDLVVMNKVSVEKFPVSIFCLPPTEMIRLALEGSGELIESPQYKIGAWPWELPTWSETFHGVVNLVDEIWAQSRFVAESYAKLGPIDIHHVPLAVEIPKPTENVRAKYRLPPHDFLFYIMFDGNSWLTRKNPIAGLRAFQLAFPKNLNGVGLVIKAMNIRTGERMWEEIVKIASHDQRIHIITETLSRQGVIDFMDSCNACISLHRSEGFGRVIAEAMLLGQPVVVTNYSGNTDFCSNKTSFLVDGEIKPLKSGDYIFWEGQSWFEPDIENAAGQLRIVLENENLRHVISEAGRNEIISNYSSEKVSDIYNARLFSIFNKLN